MPDCSMGSQYEGRKNNMRTSIVKIEMNMQSDWQQDEILLWPATRAWMPSNGTSIKIEKNSSVP